MVSITGDGESVDLSNFSFTPGYIHADSLRNDDYVDLWAPGDSSLMRGILEPHSVSLAGYVGHKVYFAFLHNSDDDYFLAVDDIMITSTTVSGTNDLNIRDFRFVTYPNPVENNLNVLYRLPEAAMVGLRITDVSGKIVAQQAPVMQQAGEQQTDLHLINLPQGTYNLSLQIGNEVVTKVFVKK